MDQAAMTRAMTMGQDEMRYVNEQGMLGAASIQTSQLALRKASDPKVRSFAQSEITEQETVARILMEHSQMTGAPMAPPRPDPRMAAMAAELERAPRGATFDQAYVRGQIAAHEQALRLQEDYIRGGRNLHLKHVAMLARGQITDHLKMLRETEGAMRMARR